ncbi:SDR family NAD(P)-dependent oxidoreductase [Pseudonocardia eucalypti]|uniref:SDR family NAD(P)-dependent oxidoreductase n=1 Tax=Pseudonocardia eucalypti TaxID=648755 RepID=A0ABP9Q4D0_9PSEU|nr:NAD(P)-dependent dehydrogenase (short-subunit alcohol dehydrogenase family) [Pseudonocardia eucalypti]
MSYDLNGRTVAVTGAGGGFGVALAEALRAEGARIALLDQDADRVHAQATRLGDTRTARGWATDVRDLHQLTTVMSEVREHFGSLDVAIAAAGVLGPVTALSATTDTDWDRVIEVNLGGVWRTFKAAAPHVTEQRGHLLAMSSMVGYIHPPMLGAYAASKAGVWALCNALRLELRTSGVTVGSVHPIIFRTPMIRDALDNPAATELVNGFSGVFQTVPLHTVVADIIRGLKQRSARVITPRRLRAAALAPGLAQALAERAYFRPTTIRHAVELGALATPRPDPAKPTA